MIISVDTKHDSIEDIKRAITMLENFVAQNGEAINNTPNGPSETLSPPEPSSADFSSSLPVSEAVSAQIPESLQAASSNVSSDSSPFDIEIEAPQVAAALESPAPESVPDFSDLFNDITVAQAVSGSALPPESEKTVSSPKQARNDDDLFSELFSSEDVPDEEEEDEEDLAPSQKPKIEFYR